MNLNRIHKRRAGGREIGTIGIPYSFTVGFSDYESVRVVLPTEEGENYEIVGTLKEMANLARVIQAAITRAEEAVKPPAVI